MKRSHDKQGYKERVILLFLFALFLLISPLMKWWASDISLWYAPYLIWGLIIALAFFLQRGSGR